MRDLEEILKPYLSDRKIAELKAYDSELNKTVQLVSVLQDDYNTLLRELYEDWDNQVHRRTVVRTLFAMVEGALFGLKSQVLLANGRGDCELSPEERERLLERKLDSAGNPTDSPKFLPLKDNIKFVFHIYAQKVCGINFDLDTSGSGWQDFLRAYDIRNDLMHPKSLDDLEVNSSKLDRVLGAAKWFNEHWNRLLSDVKSAIRRSTQAHIAEVSIKPLRESFARAFAREQSFEIDKETPVILLPPDFDETSYTVQNQTEEQSGVEAVELKHYPYKDEVILMGYSPNLNILVMTEPKSLVLQYRKLRARFITG